MITEKIENYLNEAGRHQVPAAKVRKAIERADDAFWAVIAKSFPEAKSGDFDPMATKKWDDACEEAVNQWLHLNVQKGHFGTLK